MQLGPYCNCLCSWGPTVTVCVVGALLLLSVQLGPYCNCLCSLGPTVTVCAVGALLPAPAGWLLQPAQHGKGKLQRDCWSQRKETTSRSCTLMSHLDKLNAHICLICKGKALNFVFTLALRTASVTEGKMETNKSKSVGSSKGGAMACSLCRMP